MLPFPTQIFRQNFWKSVSPNSRVENYDLLYQNSIRKYEDDFEHLVIYILYDL